MDKSKHSESYYSDQELVAHCGVNCKDCKAHSKRLIELATLLKQSLQELPLELFRENLPPFKNINQVIDFLEFLPQMGQAQTSCTSEKTPCGNLNCEIRICVKNNRFRTCAECEEYPTCSKLDFLKPHHETLISDLDLIHKHGFEFYVNEIVAKFKLEPLVIE